MAASAQRLVPAPVPAPARITRLPMRTRLAMLLRMLAIQGAWNYETLLGNGIGFSLEPALRLLPGGVHTPRFKEAMARQSKYFNAHPYLAAVAVGALARAELDDEPAERIERFRTALAGPLGSVGDRLVWAGWLPFCSLLALGVFGLGGGHVAVLATFLGVYNAGHLALRAWGLQVGWTHGLRVAQALGNPVLRRGPQVIAPLAAFAVGFGVPLAMLRIIGPGRTLLGVVLVAAALGALLIVRLHGRVEGWRLALGVLAILVLISVGGAG
ncbi:MAG TPA: PTS system mannose/fructose/sorbose family transporter subunit IID [Gemmatimonadaceae bacterium]|nr:PTS system mannose/fructose/sorbose family transporter subunit IID [Gemmatimonadaceae bacterium]